jgi:hypothetical protein
VSAVSSWHRSTEEERAERIAQMLMLEARSK